MSSTVQQANKNSTRSKSNTRGKSSMQSSGLVSTPWSNIHDSTGSSFKAVNPRDRLRPPKAEIDGQRGETLDTAVNPSHKFTRTKSYTPPEPSKSIPSTRADGAGRAESMRSSQVSTAEPFPSSLTLEPRLKIDKLTLAVLGSELSESQRLVVNDQLKHWQKKGNLFRGTTKGRGFRNVYVRKFDDGFALEIRVNPSRQGHMRQFMNFTFNPANMSDQRAKLLNSIFAKLFPGQAAETALNLRLYRVDVCADLPVDVDTLIVRQRRASVESKFFQATDAAGRVQTIYLGSITSPVHGVIYDQVASDAFKHELGEISHLPPPERLRTKSKDDAEVVITKTRFEVRRIYKDLPSVAALAEWTAPFDRWDIWQIKEVPRLRNDAGFWAYLDVVRWRGVAGARIHLARHGCADLDRFERILDKFKANWWAPEKMALDMRTAFNSMTFWPLLIRQAAAFHDSI